MARQAGDAQAGAAMERSLDKSERAMAVSNAERSENLTVAKDRAQMTATTAMSVVHVALLKAVLDSGPEGQAYYYPSLALISVCLALQVVVGILTIYTSNIKSYWTKFSSDACGDTWDNLCCCKLITEDERKARSNHKNHKSGTNSAIEVESKSKKSSKSMYRREPANSVVEMRDILLEENEDRFFDEFRCCCCWLTTKVHDDYEYEVLDLHEHWLGQMAQVEMQATSADQEHKYLTDKITSLKERIAKLEKDKTDGNTEPNSEDNLKKAREGLSAAEGQLERVEQQKHRYVVMTSQGEVLTRYADAVKRRRMLKMVTFWQNKINHLLYIVFILNAFITGLGLADTRVLATNNQPGDGDDTVTMAASVGGGPQAA